jgi:hypothetical protein
MSGSVLPFPYGHTGPGPLLTKQQLADVLSNKKRWVDYRVQEGMPYVQVRGQKRFWLDEVLAWLDARG